MSLSKNNIKLITSLQQKKYRQKYKLFVAEGIKVVKELLASNLTVNQVFCTDDSMTFDQEIVVSQITEAELKKISTLKAPNKVLALFEIPENDVPIINDFTVVLDGINDPGNLGTIIRLCDWFGVKNLLCSKNTVDCYNSKVVQATMGSLTRVCISYTDLPEVLKNSDLPKYTADMNGESVYGSILPQKAILVMGNEANGITEEIDSIINNQLTIPRFGDLKETESLNVATATAILLSEFKRR
ncbi:RNA methyltransferase, TrmH family [Tenacibaculum sp. MAR_2009_124]|uniref:TrmH family RNA methyltransferase n=1 Tax=Tenacibaculum sp. MAR_2009_124 TaxID=1250059 RepID=UPI00089D0143|nr:RNA methyltransferase [Tenacibaculum sp. MAR_2009_124]SED13545.1 RNA methyltransferase, TrmH family [Tenacibaculum sp. MAR_2009_124]